MRILLVEDEKSLSAALCRLLQQERFVVDPVYTGTDGLDFALSGAYDAIILDVMLPGMDGFTVLDRLRGQGVKTPVMMLTARGDLQDRIRGLEGGADYYLPKPFQMGELVACLRAITRRGVALTVYNTGPGIAPDHLEKIFDRFYREDTSHNSAVAGNGLGLAIARTIVQAHKGHIRAASEYGKSATFTVTLPG